MLIEPQLQADKELAYRVAKDLLQRGKAGPLVYPIFWPLIAVASDFHLEHFAIFVGTTLLMVVLTLLRLLHARLLSRCYPQKLYGWLRVLNLSPLPQAFLWSAMFALSMFLDNRNFAVFMAFSAAAMISGGTSTFSPSRFTSYAFPIVFITPALTASLIAPEQEVMSVLLVAFLVFILFVSRNQQREYWQSVDNELRLAKQSRTDVLTQLDNRRYFDEKLKEFCHLSSRNHERISVLMIDCDHFKKINDTYGHDIGDECLKHLATILNNALPRTTDVCARYGGEEFSVILVGAKVEGAKIVCERIRQMVESTPLVVGKVTINMTVSIGSVSRKLEKFFPDLPAELFKQADSALYRAKELGRNRCVYGYYNGETKDYRFDPPIDD